MVESSPPPNEEKNVRIGRPLTRIGSVFFIPGHVSPQFEVNKINTPFEVTIYQNEHLLMTK
jgi:hypothetical protein